MFLPGLLGVLFGGGAVLVLGEWGQSVVGLTGDARRWVASLAFGEERRRLGILGISPLVYGIWQIGLLSAGTAAGWIFGRPVWGVLAGVVLARVFLPWRLAGWWLNWQRDCVAQTPLVAAQLLAGLSLGDDRATILSEAAANTFGPLRGVLHRMVAGCVAGDPKTAIRETAGTVDHPVFYRLAREMEGAWDSLPNAATFAALEETILQGEAVAGELRGENLGGVAALLVIGGVIGFILVAVIPFGAVYLEGLFG